MRFFLSFANYKLLKNVSYSTLRIIVVSLWIRWFVLSIAFLSLLVRHGFVNEAYDNLGGMNLTPVEATAQPASQVPSQEPVSYLTGIN